MSHALTGPLPVCTSHVSMPGAEENLFTRARHVLMSSLLVVMSAESALTCARFIMVLAGRSWTPICSRPSEHRGTAVRYTDRLCPWRSRRSCLLRLIPLTPFPRPSRGRPIAMSSAVFNPTLSVLDPSTPLPFHPCPRHLGRPTPPADEQALHNYPLARYFA